MKVTKNRLKIHATWCVIKNLNIIIKLAWYKFYDEMLEAYIKNPNIKW